MNLFIWACVRWVCVRSHEKKMLLFYLLCPITMFYYSHSRSAAGKKSSALAFKIKPFLACTVFALYLWIQQTLGKFFVLSRLCKFIRSTTSSMSAKYSPSSPSQLHIQRVFAVISILYDFACMYDLITILRTSLQNLFTSVTSKLQPHNS